MKNIKMIAEFLIKSKAKALFILFFSMSAALPTFAAIPIEQWSLPNGAQVYLVQSPGIPMVDVQIDFDAGGRRDPAAQSGLASVTAGMNNNGTEAQAADPAKGLAAAPAIDENAVSEAWADLGASFSASAGPDRMSFALRTLTDPGLLAKATALAARQLGHPSFPQTVWERDRQRLVASLEEANRRVGTVAARAYGKALYGSHPYGQEMTAQTLAAISVADMARFYRQSIVPCRARLTVVGAVNRAQAEALAAALLARLPGADAAGQACTTPNAANAVQFPRTPVPEVQPLRAAQEIRIPFESAQAHVLMGQPGYKRDDPDHFALTVGNYILGGGGFVSRLTEAVREKRGLSYSVSSHFSPGLHAGAFTVGLQTRPDQAVQALAVAREVLARFVAEGPTEAELRAAKDNLIGGFPLLIDSNAKLLGNVANIAWNNLPLNYLDTWTQQVEALTVADVKAAFARKLQPEKMVTVIVGGTP